MSEEQKESIASMLASVHSRTVEHPLTVTVDKQKKQLIKEDKPKYFFRSHRPHLKIPFTTQRKEKFAFKNYTFTTSNDTVADFIRKHLTDYSYEVTENEFYTGPQTVKTI